VASIVGIVIIHGLICRTLLKTNEG